MGANWASTPCAQLKVNRTDLHCNRNDLVEKRTHTKHRDKRLLSQWVHLCSGSCCRVCENQVEEPACTAKPLSNQIPKHRLIFFFFPHRNRIIAFQPALPETGIKHSSQDLPVGEDHLQLHCAWSTACTHHPSPSLAQEAGGAKKAKLTNAACSIMDLSHPERLLSTANRHQSKLSAPGTYLLSSARAVWWAQCHVHAVRPAWWTCDCCLCPFREQSQLQMDGIRGSESSCRIGQPRFPPCWKQKPTQQCR